MSPKNIPVAEVELSVELARQLLEDQHLDLATLPIREASNGWDNVIYRLGDDLCLRLPRRQLGADLIEHEQRWLPQLAARLPLPIPAPVRTGRPALGYPWGWSVTPWFEGAIAVDAPPTAADTVETVAAFLHALHQPAPADAPVNRHRGIDLEHRHESFELQLAKLGRRVLGHEAEQLSELWHELTTAPPWGGPALWLHGDLHLLNVVVRDGALAAVIDWGDLTSGDPATDLAVAWMLFEEDQRRELRQCLAQGGAPYDDAVWQRARAWALLFAVIYLANSADQPPLSKLGELLLARVMES